MKIAEREMKAGDIVRHRGEFYRVGALMTDVSVELVDLRYPRQGIWVSRAEVHWPEASEACQLVSG